MNDDIERDEELDALRGEVARLRVENEQLGGRYRVPPEEVDAPEPTRPIRVLLLPDPTQATNPDGPGPQAAANAAQVVVSHLRKSQVDADWRAEHDLARIPRDAQCFELGEVARRLWYGAGPLPKQYRVEEDESGERRLTRCLVDGDPHSGRFRVAYDRQLQIVDELLNEGQAAHGVGAQHHAGWTLKAVDVVLAQAALALASFQAGRDDWKAELDKPRPEYNPRYEITSEQPAGW